MFAYDRRRHDINHVVSGADAIELIATEPDTPTAGSIKELLSEINVKNGGSPDKGRLDGNNDTLFLDGELPRRRPNGIQFFVRNDNVQRWPEKVHIAKNKNRDEVSAERQNEIKKEFVHKLNGLLTDAGINVHDVNLLTSKQGEQVHASIGDAILDYRGSALSQEVWRVLNNFEKIYKPVVDEMWATIEKEAVQSKAYKVALRGNSQRVYVVKFRTSKLANTPLGRPVDPNEIHAIIGGSNKYSTVYAFCEEDLKELLRELKKAKRKAKKAK